MKKYLTYAFAGAIALAGASGFTACSSDSLSDLSGGDTNPTYDAATGTVKSQFVLNIASNAKTNTRSGSTTVQAGGNNFRGIDNTLLFAFKTSGKGFIDASFAGAAAANRYDLGTVAAANSLDNGSNSHRILELAMPTGTDAMLFYGKAIKSSTDKDEEVGKVTYSIPGSTATAFHFDLNNRVGDNATKYEHAAQILAAIMTKIVNVTGTYTVVKANYPSWPGNNGDVLTSTWKEMNPEAKPVGQGRTLSPLEEILHKAFTTLTTYGTNELRGGSAHAIHTTVKDLYSVTIKVANATPTSPYEELAKHLAQQIKRQLLVLRVPMVSRAQWVQVGMTTGMMLLLQTFPASQLRLICQRVQHSLNILLPQTHFLISTLESVCLTNQHQQTQMLIRSLQS